MLILLLIFLIVFYNSADDHSQLKNKLITLHDKLNVLQGQLNEVMHSPLKTVPQIAKFSEIRISGPLYELLALENQRTFFNPFEFVMGVSEQIFKSFNSQEQLEFWDAQTYRLKNRKNHKQFVAGNFIQSTIHDLRAYYGLNKRGQGCIFNIIEAADKPYDDGTGKPNWFRSLVDIGALQADKQNRGAAFQVASNFNALEAGGDPNSGISPYLTDSYFVQGEAAAISGLPGTIMRNYFVKHIVGNQTFIGQLQKQINFLAKIPAIAVQHGYPSSIDFNAFTNLSDQARDHYIENVAVGFQQNVQVVSGFGPLKYKGELTGTMLKAIKIDDSKQQINQIFTAALMVTGNAQQYEPVAQVILDAAYEGTLKVCYAQHVKKIYLTLIGGGVFDNKLPWIGKAIKRALDDFVDIGDMEINLIIYEYPKNATLTERDTFKKEMLSYVVATNGKYISYKTDGMYEVKPS